MGKRAYVLVLALVALLGAPALAGDPKRDAKAYAHALKSIRAQAAKGKGKAGLTRLTRLLEEHRQAPYIRSGLVDLEDLVRRLVFVAQNPPADPQSVVSGKLKSYNPETGAIKLIYTSKTMKDWSLDRGTYAHAAAFSGPFTIEIKGASYPAATKDSAIIWTGFMKNPDTGEDQQWLISFGTEQHVVGSNDVWLPASITHHDGDNAEVIAEKTITPARAGRSFKLVVKVKRKSIEAKANGKLIGRAKKHADVFGSVMFTAKGFSEVKLSGTIESSWIQGKLDKLSEAARTKFRASFKAKAHLPAWVYEAATETPATDRGHMPYRPGGVSASHRSAYDGVLRLLDEGEFSEARTKIVGLHEQGLNAAACGFLNGYAQLGQYEVPAAMKSLDAAIAADPDFARAKLLRGLALRFRGDTAKAQADLEGVFKSYRPDEAFYQRLSVRLLLEGRLGAVRQTIQTATEHGVRSEVMDIFTKTLVKAERGPDWRKAYEYKTANYHVITDIGKEMAREAAQTLEAMLRLYRGSLERVTRDKTRLFRIYLFSGQSSYLGYMGDLSMVWGGGGSRTAGVYSPMLKQLLVWNLPERSDMMETIRHEGFHQFLDRYLPRAPVWFNEGMAEYYENATTKNGKITPGQIDHYALDLLEKKGLLPMRALLHAKSREFYSHSLHAYAQAWLVIHMLQHGNREQRKRFKAFLSALETLPPARAMAKVFPDDVIEELAEDADIYLTTLGEK